MSWALTFFSLAVPTAYGGCKVLDEHLNRAYEGGCRNGLAHGSGRASGRDNYDGTFEQGLPSGRGVYVWSTGSRYEGAFANGVSHGKGVYHFGPDTAEAGARYEGDFQAGRFTGRAKLIRANGAEYEGNFRDGRVEGVGTYRSPTGFSYFGDFQAGEYSGWGTLNYPDGLVYRGHFKQGEPQGRGYFIRYDRTAEEVRFTDGKLAWRAGPVTCQTLPQALSCLPDGVRAGE